MNYEYRCPKCHGYIRIDDHIILSAKNKGFPGGLILLHPEPGNYAVIKHATFKYDKGDLVEFYCPICHHSLNSTKHMNLAVVLMTDDKGKDFDIYFSKIAGEYSTLKMIGEHMEVFGEHSGEYLDFFSLSQNY